MLTPAQRKRAQLIRSRPQESPAPLLGWNTRDPFEAMDPKDAILLDNWFPDFAGLTSRAGSVLYVSGLDADDPVQTLTHFRTSTYDALIAACGGSLYDVSTGGTSTVLGSGFASDVWQTCNFNGRHFFVNGQDPAQIYDGTTLAATGFTGAPMNTMNGVGAFNNRLYFWTGNDPSFWYGPVLGISGALSNFPLSMVTREGGNLMAVEVLSYDGGTGIDDYTCFFMTSGEVLLYQGTDPSNPNNWALVGRYIIPTPVKQRGITRYGGDVYVITIGDHQQLSEMFIALKLGEIVPRTKISGAAKAAYQVGSKLPGWQAIYYPAGTRMIYNIPNPDGTFSQHIYNTSTKAWCRFRGLNAWCWGTYQEKLYFGGANGQVFQADVGTSDSGNSILTLGQQAWQTFGTPLKKRLTALRPIMQSPGISQFNLVFGFDYQNSELTFPGATVGPLNALIWGTGQWGPPRVWSAGGGVADPRWHIGGGEGSAIGIGVSSHSVYGTTWIRTDLLLEPGSAL